MHAYVLSVTHTHTLTYTHTPLHTLSLSHTHTHTLNLSLPVSQINHLLGAVIEMWVNRMDNITQPERRKLSALALLSLLPSEHR